MKELPRLSVKDLREVQKHIAARLETQRDEVGTKVDVRVLLDAAKYEASKASGAVYSYHTVRALNPLATLAAESVSLVIDTLFPDLTQNERLAAFKWFAECARLTMLERGVKAITAETILSQLNRDPYRVVEESFPGYASRGLIQTVFQNYCRIQCKPSDKEE